MTTAIPDPYDARPAPGGVRRFVIASALAIALLAGVVVGLSLWMRATSRTEYDGPPPLTYPENRPYR